MTKQTDKTGRRRLRTLGTVVVLAASNVAWAQSPLTYSIATPRPINPAGSTSTPSAPGAQHENFFLGSVSSQNTGVTLKLSLNDAIGRGLRYNLGLIEAEQSSADVRAERLRALSVLLPQVFADVRQGFENLSFKEIGIRGPSTSGAFGYQDAHVSVSEYVYNPALRDHYRARKREERASMLSVQDSRDAVASAVGTAYFQVLASAARVESTKAQLATAAELDRETANRVRNEVSPEIDSIRAQVARQSAEQRLTNATNQFQKDKLTLARIIGLSIDQDFEFTDQLDYRPLVGLTSEIATADALASRADLQSAEASVEAAMFALHAQKGQRLPDVSVTAAYGGAGANVGNFNQVYAVDANVSVPIYTGGRIRADITQAEAYLDRKKAEYEDLKGCVAYDVRVAWLDVSASDSSVRLAQRNKALVQQALKQSQDRYTNGVTNYLEVIQAQEAVVEANENYIESLFSYDVALTSLARAIGGAETRIPKLLSGTH